MDAKLGLGHFQKKFTPHTTTTLELMFEDVPKDIDNFTKSFQNGKLKILKISANEIELTPSRRWYWIVDLLNSNLELEKIKISVSYPFFYDTNAEDEFYKTLIKAISKLKQLRKLKLSLNYLNLKFAIGSLFSSISSAFSIKELYKLKNIEDISFESDCMSTQMWADFINLSQYFGSRLKKLKINLGKILPEITDLEQLRKFICSLTAIEVLDLKQFEIPSSKFWKEFINCLTKLKNLRKLKLRTIKMEEKN